MRHLLPDVLERLDPERPIAPVVFDSPHSGNTYPDDFGNCIDHIHLRRTEDAFIDELFGDAPAMGATLLRALFPRSYVDPNRSPDDIDPGEPIEVLEHRPVRWQCRCGLEKVQSTLASLGPE